MGNRISTLTLTTKGVATKLALGAASLMVLTVIGSATLAGATPVTGTAEAEGSTSLAKHNEQDKADVTASEKNKENDKNAQNQRDKEHHANNGHHGYGNSGHGYGGNENAVHSNVSINQSGHDNVLTVIFNYIFG